MWYNSIMFWMHECTLNLFFIDSIILCIFLRSFRANKLIFVHLKAFEWYCFYSCWYISSNRRWCWPLNTFGKSWIDRSLPPSTNNDNDRNGYKPQCKKAFVIIATSLVDKKNLRIKGCKQLANMWKTLCNIHETKNLSSILFIMRNHQDGWR